LHDRCYAVAEILCALDEKCLFMAISHLLSLQTASGVDPTDPIANLKNDAFYSFTHSVCIMAVLNFPDTQAANLAVQLIVLVTYSLLNQPQISEKFFQLMDQVWDNPSTKTILRETTNLSELLEQVLVVDTQQLFNPSCESFVKKVLNQDKGVLPTESIVKVESSLFNSTNTNVENLQKGVEDRDLGLAELSIVNLAHTLKAAQIYYSEDNKKDFVSANKDALLRASQLVQDEMVTTIDKAEEIKQLLLYFGA